MKREEGETRTVGQRVNDVQDEVHGIVVPGSVHQEAAPLEPWNIL